MVGKGFYEGGWTLQNCVSAYHSCRLRLSIPLSLDTYHKFKFLWNDLNDWVPKNDGMTSLMNRSLLCTLKDLPSGNHPIGGSLGIPPPDATLHSHLSNKRCNFHGKRNCCATPGVKSLILKDRSPTVVAVHGTA